VSAATGYELGRPIKGPSALGNDARRFAHLTWTLAVTDFKLRFFGSVLGYLWSVFRPLLLFGVIYAVYSIVVGKSVVPYFPSAMLFGVVLFTFFSEATKTSVNSLVAREPLVRKIEFPRAAVPLSVVLTASFNLLLNLVPVLVFLLAAGAGVRWSWLEVPVLLGGLALFACGVAMLVSALFVRYRDMDPIWDVVLQVMFYLSPIFYPIELVIAKTHDWVANVMLLNPFAAVIQQGRRALFGPSYDSVWTVMGGPLALVPLGIAVFLVVYGTWYFNRQAPRIAEEL